jgi:hypothetical protein
MAADLGGETEVELGQAVAVPEPVGTAYYYYSAWSQEDFVKYLKDRERGS